MRCGRARRVHENRMRLELVHRKGGQRQGRHGRPWRRDPWAHNNRLSPLSTASALIPHRARAPRSSGCASSPTCLCTRERPTMFQKVRMAQRQPCCYWRDQGGNSSAHKLCACDLIVSQDAQRWAPKSALAWASLFNWLWQILPSL